MKEDLSLRAIFTSRRLILHPASLLFWHSDNLIFRLRLLQPYLFFTYNIFTSDKLHLNCIKNYAPCPVPAEMIRKVAHKNTPPPPSYFETKHDGNSYAAARRCRFKVYQFEKFLFSWSCSIKIWNGGEKRVGEKTRKNNGNNREAGKQRDADWLLLLTAKSPLPHHCATRKSTRHSL